MADTPNFLRAAVLVRQLAPLRHDDPRRRPLEVELDRLTEQMTRLEYDRLHLFYLRLREGE